MNAWELVICVACLCGLASYWALPDWWAAKWRDLRVSWWERIVGMTIVGYAGYLVGLYAC